MSKIKISPQKLSLIKLFNFTKLTLLGLLCSLSFFSLGSNQALASVDNFVINDYRIDFVLSKNADDHSVLKTTETITATFPETDQNHGLERWLPRQYQKHSTNLEIISITDADGASLPYHSENNNSFLRLRVGDADTYVHGEQTYVITYEQQDVTHYFADTNADEFYWDTVGTDWRVPIENLRVTLSLEDQLTTALTGETSCYLGILGSNQTCELIRRDNHFIATAKHLQPGENLTLAIGFTAHTFTPYQTSLGKKLFTAWLILQGFLLPISIILLIWIMIRRYGTVNRVRELFPVVTEFFPPQNTSVSVTAGILPAVTSVFPAQLLDLAVRGFLRINETKAANHWWQTAQFEIEILQDLSPLKPEEREIITDLYEDESPVVGSSFAMNQLRTNFKISSRLSDNPQKVEQLIRHSYQLRALSANHQKSYRRRAKIIFIFAVVTLSPILLILSLITLAISGTFWILTDEGLALARHRQGLRQYIKVAEAERLRMLQSPGGAEKVQIDTNDPKQMLKLYEQNLPYAVLFGMEKEWSKELAQYYERAEVSPAWFVGANGLANFNPTSFTTALSSFSTTNSSSGGSGGGGSSGGGGGGGGGGGW